MATIASGTITADGTASACIWRNTNTGAEPGNGTFIATGTFGSGTVTLKASIDGGTTKFDVGTDTTLTASGGGNFDIKAPVSLYVVTSGSTTPSISWQIDNDS